MDAALREKTLWAAALIAALVGAVLVYVGVGAGRAHDIGWFEYIREMFALVDAVSVTPAGIAGFLLIGSGTLAAAFLLGHRWSVPRGIGQDRSPRSRALTLVRWGAAALALIGLVIVLVILSAPQPFFSYDPAPYLESPSVIEDPTLLLDSLFVSSAAFVGAALLWTGLAVSSFLLGRYGAPAWVSTVSLPGAFLKDWLWWTGVALTAVGLLVVVISRVSLPARPIYDDAMPAVVPSAASFTVVHVGIEEPDLAGWAAASFTGAALTILGMMLMSIVVAHSPSARRAPVGAGAGD